MVQNYKIATKTRTNTKYLSKSRLYPFSQSQINALTASNEVIVPLNAHYLSKEGVNKLLNAVRSLRKEINQKLNVKGFVITMTTKKNTVSDSIERKIRNKFRNKVFDTKIPYSPQLIDAPSYHKPILLHAGKSHGAIAYKKLAEEFLSR